jgi:hypothetical protein
MHHRTTTPLFERCGCHHAAVEGRHAAMVSQLVWAVCSRLSYLNTSTLTVRSLPSGAQLW